MQIIDNIFVLHNLTDKSTQMYDFKIQDYSYPLGKPDLQVDSRIVLKKAYMSDAIF